MSKVFRSLSLALIGLSGLFASAAGDPAAKPIVRLEVRGAITPPMSDYLRDGIAQADARDAQAVLIEIDTPGGLLDSTREIIQSMLNARVPVIVYTAPAGARATSAGAFIMMAADVAAMAPDTHLGAAHPVSLTGGSDSAPASPGKDGAKKREESSVMGEKAVSDAAAYIRGLAADKGRNAAWAERAVRESVSLTAKEALAQKVVEIIAPNREALLRDLDGRRLVKRGESITLRTSGAPVQEVPMSTARRILQILANPSVAYLFIILGVYGFIYEFSSPGIGFGAVAGFLFLTLAAYSLSILPVNYSGLLLIALGIVLLVLELKIVSHGLLTVGGLALLALGSFFLFDSAEPYLRVSVPLILGVLGSTALLFTVAISKVIRARHLKPSTGLEAMIGEVGEVRQALTPRGMIFVDGELWTAEADMPIAIGQRVVVTDAHGQLLKVKLLEAPHV